MVKISKKGGSGKLISVNNVLMLIAGMVLLGGFVAWYNNDRLIDDMTMAAANLSAMTGLVGTDTTTISSSSSSSRVTSAGIKSSSLIHDRSVLEHVQQALYNNTGERELKAWRARVQQACDDASNADEVEKVADLNSQIFRMPPSTELTELLPIHKMPESELVRPCKRVVMDFGANIGDTSAHVIDSGMITCDRKDIPIKKTSTTTTSKPYTHFNVETKAFELAKGRNQLTHHLIRMMRETGGKENLGPEDYCYYGVEGNPHFTKRLQAIEDFVMATRPRPIERIHFFTESVGAGQDGPTKLYLDTINSKQNFWGSSIFKDHQDVRASGGDMGNLVEADVMGYTIGTLMRKTLLYFDESASPEDRTNNHLVLKVDIEGGEYPLLFQAGMEGTLCEFAKSGNKADLFIEFHSQRVTGKHDFAGKMGHIKEKLTSCGVNFRNLAAWWA